MPVNEAITDSVTQVNTKVVGETPAMAMGNLLMATSQALSNAGAAREEVAEVLAMCVQMGGGPAVMYSAKALECFDQLSAGS